MSLHTNRSFHVAAEHGASAARTFETWTALMDLSKRELAEIALHLAGICTDSYDDAMRSNGALNRLMEEHDNLKANGII